MICCKYTFINELFIVGHIVIEDNDLKIETALHLLPLAHYFNLPDFAEEFSNHFQGLLTFENLCRVFNIIHFLEDNPLTKLCCRLMQQITPDILDNGSLLQMNDTAVEKILTLDDVNIPSEIDLLEAMLNWAKVKCTERILPLTPVNMRSILNDRLRLVRFDAMSSDMFIKSVQLVGDGFFSETDIGHYIKRICFNTLKNENKLPRCYTGLPNLNRLEFKFDQMKCVTNPTVTLRALNDKTNLLIFCIEISGTMSEITDPKDDGIKHHFIRIGDLVIFHQPLQFKEDICAITFQGLTDSSYKIHDFIENEDIYIKRTIISAILYNSDE